MTQRLQTDVANGASLEAGERRYEVEFRRRGPLGGRITVTDHAGQPVLNPSLTRSVMRQSLVLPETGPQVKGE